MKKSYVLIVIFLIFIIVVAVVGSSVVTGNIEVKQEKDILLVQSNKEIYFSVYGYSVDNPNVIVNPYGNSPLTALIMFETDYYSEVYVTIKSKSGDSDINYKFDKDKYHMIPIYGLYADYDNTVIIKSEGIENVISIKTNKLPDDFMYVPDVQMDNFMFYNGNYPYAIDINGEVRWYLNSNYFGNITFMDNANFIIGSDRYDERGNTISFYKMNLLGKIYGEYLLKDSYYGYSALYNGDILVLSDKILSIDDQTGDIISDYGQNDGFDYLTIYDDNIIVRRDGNFYKITDDSLEEIQYDFSSVKFNFYNNINNYDIVPPSRFGVLSESLISKKKITLVNYEKLGKLEDISIVREVGRIKVTNSAEGNIFLILDRFMDKRIYEIDNLKYINTTGLSGKYTVYFKIDGEIYKTDYYIEV